LKNSVFRRMSNCITITNAVQDPDRDRETKEVTQEETIEISHNRYLIAVKGRDQVEAIHEQ